MSKDGRSRHPLTGAEDCAGRPQRKEVHGVSCRSTCGEASLLSAGMQFPMAMLRISGGLRDEPATGAGCGHWQEYRERACFSITVAIGTKAPCPAREGPACGRVSSDSRKAVIGRHARRRALRKPRRNPQGSWSRPTARTPIRATMMTRQVDRSKSCRRTAADRGLRRGGRTFCTP